MERPSQGCASILQRVRFAGSVPSSNDLHNWQWVLNLLLDRPVLGGSLFQFIAPVVFAAIRKPKLKVTVVELLIANNSWVRHLSGSFTMHFLLEFGIGKLCDLLEQVHLSDEPDTFTLGISQSTRITVRLLPTEPCFLSRPRCSVPSNCGRQLRHHASGFSFGCVCTANAGLLLVDFGTSYSKTMCVSCVTKNQKPWTILS